MPRVSLTNDEALAAFAIKCKLDRSPAALVALNPINMLTLKMGQGGWSRILTAVRDGGLAPNVIHNEPELHEYIEKHVTVVIIGAVDWSPLLPLQSTIAWRLAAKGMVGGFRLSGLAAAGC